MNRARATLRESARHDFPFSFGHQRSEAWAESQMTFRVVASELRELIMSVYYYITRNSGPFAKQGRQMITEAEWRSAVATVPELAIEQPELPGPRGADCGVWAVWRSYTGGYPAWFVLLRNGDVELKGMDGPLFVKFKQLASALDARIFCETGDELK